MRRRNHRSKTGETLGNTDPSCHRPDIDPRRRKRVTFVGVDDRSPSNDTPEGRGGRSVDAKTSEYAFFKKLKSDANLRFGSKLHHNVDQNSKMLESNVGTAGTNDRVNKGSSFSTPVETARHKEGSKQSSPAFRAMHGGDKNSIPGANNARPAGINTHTGDVLSMKRRRLLQWVRDIWFPDVTELSSSGCDLVPVLLTRLFPEPEHKHASKIPRKERADRVEKPKFLGSAGSKFLDRSHKCCMEVEQRPHMDNGRSIFWLGWPEESIAPALKFPTAHGHSSFILRDPKEISFSISYPKGDSFYRPPFLKQKSLGSCSDEGNLSCYPISSPRFRNYNMLSSIYHREEDGYSRSGILPLELEEPTLLLEWDTVSRRNADDLPLGYHTKLIAYPNVSTSSGDDHPWNFDDASRDLSTKDLCSLPLIPHSSADTFFFAVANPTSSFEEEHGEPVIGDENAVSCLNLHTKSSNGLTRESGYYHQLPFSPVEHYPYAYQTMCFPFSSSGDAYLLEAPRRNDHFRPHGWSEGLD